jgi:hypothetical protein
MSDKIITVTFQINGRVHLDIARAEEDPYWEQVSRGIDMESPEGFELAARNYISAYLRNEQLLSDVPWSCGPASIYGVSITIDNKKDEKEEVKNVRSNSTSTGKCV